MEEPDVAQDESGLNWTWYEKTLRLGPNRSIKGSSIAIIGGDCVPRRDGVEGSEEGLQFSPTNIPCAAQQHSCTALNATLSTPRQRNREVLARLRLPIRWVTTQPSIQSRCLLRYYVGGDHGQAEEPLNILYHTDFRWRRVMLFRTEAIRKSSGEGITCHTRAIATHGAALC